MKFCIDDANVEKIRRIYEYYPVDGVSTNPSILAKAGRDPFEVLKEIREIIGEDGELFVQATATTSVRTASCSCRPRQRPQRAWSKKRTRSLKCSERPLW